MHGAAAVGVLSFPGYLPDAAISAVFLPSTTFSGRPLQMPFNSAFVLLANIAIISCGVFAGIALLWPNTFARIARFLGTWVRTRPTLPFVDSRVDIDEFVLGHTRVFGGVVFAAAAFWAVLFYAR